MESFPIHIRMRTKAHTKIFFRLPVNAVVSALSAFFRKVGNFVLLITHFRQIFHCPMIHFPIQLLFCRGNFAFFIFIIKRCAFLQNETVCRNMFRVHRNDAFHRFLPVRHCLVGQSKHQVCIHIFKTSFSDSFEIILKNFDTMDSAQTFQQTILPCLYPHAQTVESHFFQGIRHFSAQCAGVGFRSDFCILRNIPAFKNRSHQLFQHGNGKRCRCSAAKKYGNHLFIRIFRSSFTYFLRQCVYISLHHAFFPSPGRKIAIETFLFAERDMDI